MFDMCLNCLNFKQNFHVIRAVKTPHGFDFYTLAAPSSTEKLRDFSEDCLNEVSSAAAQLFEAAQEISGSGVAFFLDTYSWLSKKK